MTTPAAPVTVTSVLQSIWDDIGEPLAVAQIAVGFALIPAPIGPFLASAWAWLLKAPIIGTWIQNRLKGVVDNLIAQGVIEVKIGIIDKMSEAARAKWAKELVILKQYQGSGQTMTPAEQAAYDAALQKLVQQHGGVVQG